MKRIIAMLFILVLISSSIYIIAATGDSDAVPGNDTDVTEPEISGEIPALPDEDEWDVAPEEWTDKEYFTYSTETRKGEQIVVITGLVSGYPQKLVIPAKIDGLPVREIAFGAFQSCEELVSVTVPRSVTEIKSAVFANCKNLEYVKLPDGLTAISEFLFDMCSNLAEITIPENVTSIGVAAFYGCEKLEIIEIPDGVVSLGDDAFRRCFSLKSIEIPDGVKALERGIKFVAE